MNKNLYDTILETLEEMNTYDLIAIHNEYCGKVSSDDYIYSMDEFDELMSGASPCEIARSIFFGDFNPNHDYFTFNGYGNLESVEEYYLKTKIYTEDIADHIATSLDPLYNDDIEAILDEWNEDETED